LGNTRKSTRTELNRETRKATTNMGRFIPDLHNHSRIKKGDKGGSKKNRKTKTKKRGFKKGRKVQTSEGGDKIKDTKCPVPIASSRVNLNTTPQLK